MELLKAVIEEVEMLRDCHIEGLVLCMNMSSPVLDESRNFSSLLLSMLTRFHHLVSLEVNVQILAFRYSMIKKTKHYRIKVTC